MNSSNGRVTDLNQSDTESTSYCIVIFSDVVHIESCEISQDNHWKTPYCHGPPVGDP